MSSSCCGVVTSLPCAAAWLAIDSKVGLFASPWLGKLRMFRLFWLYAGLLLSLSTGWCWCFWYVFLYGWKRLGSCLTVLIVVGITPGAPFPVTTSRTWGVLILISTVRFGTSLLKGCSVRQEWMCCTWLPTYGVFVFVFVFVFFVFVFHRNECVIPDCSPE